MSEQAQNSLVPTDILRTLEMAAREGAASRRTDGDHDCAASYEQAAEQARQVLNAASGTSTAQQANWPEVILMARGWFEGNPEAALAELEHRARSA